MAARMKIIVFWDVVSQKLADVSEVFTASIIRAMSSNFNETTRGNITEVVHFQKLIKEIILNTK
jgi:hypothetical protein